MQPPTLLITASLDAGATPMVALRDVHERTLRHMEGLLAWLSDPGINRIVFTKNCRAQIREEILMEVARAHGKELEFLQINSSPRTVLQGKGFGEGDLIRQALERSTILRAASDFIKVTGKLYAPGWEKIFRRSGEGEFYFSLPQSSVKLENLRLWTRAFYRSENGSRFMGFLKRRLRVPWEVVAATPRGWIDTRIYRVNKEFYMENLLETHRRVQDYGNYKLENAVFDDLILHSALVRMIEISPIIIGTSGSVGTTAGEFSEKIRQEAKLLTRKLLKD
jgi:hypothetical protein